MLCTLGLYIVIVLWSRTRVGFITIFIFWIRHVIYKKRIERYWDSRDNHKFLCRLLFFAIEVTDVTWKAAAKACQQLLWKIKRKELIRHDIQWFLQDPGYPEEISQNVCDPVLEAVWKQCVINGSLFSVSLGLKCLSSLGMICCLWNQDWERLKAIIGALGGRDIDYWI